MVTPEVPLLGASGGGSQAAPRLSEAHWPMSMQGRLQGKELTTFPDGGGWDRLTLQPDLRLEGRLRGSQDTSRPQGIDSEASLLMAIGFNQALPTGCKQLDFYAPSTSELRRSPCIDRPLVQQVDGFRAAQLEDDRGEGMAEGTTTHCIGEEEDVDLCLRL